MKQNVKILSILLAITVMLGLFPAVCFASYRVEPLKTNQWYSLKDSSSNMTIYRVKVSVDTALIIEWKRYITDDKEAKKVLVDEMSSTLYTVAKDTKLQVEFNPAAKKKLK